MKKPFQLVLFFFVFPIFLLYSCKKINEATLLGDGLVPEVDNINTFDTTFATETDNVLLHDTIPLLYSDAVALGTISNDPEFGQTSAAVYFQIAPAAYGTYPFSGTDPAIDSVVLSLDYVGGYGDTNIVQTVRVYELARTASFNDTTNYTFSHPRFETTGAELGSAMFSMSQLKDSFTVSRPAAVRVARQLRIRLDPALGARFASYDTANTPNGGYNSDTLFKDLFRGFALKTDEGTGNGLAYFNLTNAAKTALTIYYRATKNGAPDTAAAVFIHTARVKNNGALSKGGQANSIIRQRAGGWDAYLNNAVAQDDKLYIQSTPGAAGHIAIPGLAAFPNALVHRAELIATRIPTPLEATFPAPNQLFLDKVNAKDSAFIFHEYLSSSNAGISFNFNSFGGHRRADNTYRFNVTSAVQDILARDSTNYGLRIYAPFKTAPLDVRLNPAVPRELQVLPFPAYGRVVLAGGNYAEPAQQLRLHVIYSKL